MIIFTIGYIDETIIRVRTICSSRYCRCLGIVIGYSVSIFYDIASRVFIRSLRPSNRIAGHIICFMTEGNNTRFRSNAVPSNSNTLFAYCNRLIANGHSMFCISTCRATTNTSRIVTLHY